MPDDEADYDTPQSGSQGTIQYQDPEDELEEPVSKEEIERLQSEESEPTKRCEKDFVQFDGDYFVLLGQISSAQFFYPMMSKVSRRFASI